MNFRKSLFLIILIVLGVLYVILGSVTIACYYKVKQTPPPISPFYNEWGDEPCVLDVSLEQVEKIPQTKAVFTLFSSGLYLFWPNLFIFPKDLKLGDIINVRFISDVWPPIKTSSLLESELESIGGTSTDSGPLEDGRKYYGFFFKYSPHFKLDPIFAIGKKAGYAASDIKISIPAEYHAMLFSVYVYPGTEEFFKKILQKQKIVNSVERRPKPINMP